MITNYGEYEESMGSDLCVLCGEHEESVLHLFSACFMAFMVWQGISSWCRLPPIYVLSVVDLLELQYICHWNGRKKKAFNAIILTAMWCIWKVRNDAVYNGRQRSYVGLFKEVQSLSFFWMKNRASWGSL
ncbi:hypothetical protein R6Q57_029409 [Mikania cordata]